MAYLKKALGTLRSTVRSGVTLNSPTFINPALGTPASGIMTNMTGAVTASIEDDAITSAKIATGAVTSDGIGAGAVVTAGLGASAVTSAKVSGLVKGDVGLGNVDNDSTSTIQSGTTKANVGLGNVDNESKATMFTSPTFTGSAVLGTPASGSMQNTYDGRYTARHTSSGHSVTGNWEWYSPYSVMGGASTYWICFRTFTSGNTTYGYNNRDSMLFTHPSSNLTYLSYTHFHRTGIGDGTMYNGCFTMSSFHTSSSQYACYGRLKSTANSNTNGILAPQWYQNVSSSSTSGAITYYDFF